MARSIALFGEALSTCLAAGCSRAALRRALPVLLALAALKLVVSLVVLRSGFLAISDDDFARVVIAQEFAHAPKIDPSGTSWLPLPFFVTGVPMLVLGRSFLVARGVAIACGVISIWLVYAAARLLGASPRGALLGAFIASIFPYSAWLGAATVPELPTAALVLFGTACLAASTSPEHDARGPVLALLGGAALSAAAACRYEAWPVALGAAFLALRDVRRTGRRAYAFAALAALFFPLAWLAHGQYHYADPFFFIKRVADYKAALGEAAASLPSLIFGYPVALVRNEPELCFATLGALAFGGTRLRWARPTFLLGMQLLVLIVGDVRGGAPTHHPERAVLAVCLFVAVLLGAALSEIVAGLGPRGAAESPGAHRARLRRILGAVMIGAALGPTLARPFWTRVGVFASRDAELALGEAARSLVPPGERVVVATDDYGYFALLAGFAEPERCLVFDSHDPRKAKDRGTVASGPESLWAFADGERAHFAMLPRTWSAQLAARSIVTSADSGGSQTLHAEGNFALLRLFTPSSAPAGGLRVGNPPPRN